MSSVSINSIYAVGSISVSFHSIHIINIVVAVRGYGGKGELIKVTFLMSSKK